MPSNSYQRTQLEANQRYLVDEPLAVQKSLTAVGRFNAQIIFMADQIERNSDRNTLDNTFIVTSFTDLNKLSETTPFGRLVAENLIHELQVRKWKVYEVRLSNSLIINENGEFSLSRDIKKIKDTYKVGGIVTGTYSEGNNHVIVNARVMDINTGLVTSSGQAYFPSNWFTDALLFNENSLKAVKIVGDTPYSCRDASLCWNENPSKTNTIEGVER
jgi:TolB-like protein